jgi:hypothetical protein
MSTGFSSHYLGEAVVTQTPRNDLKTVETALIYVVRLVDELNRSTDPHGFLYEPEIILWAVEQLNPQILQKVKDDGLTNIFRRRLVQFGELRSVAETELSLEYSPPYDWGTPSEWPALDYIADVLDSSIWCPTDRSAIPSLMRVLHDASELPTLTQELKAALGKRAQAVVAGRTSPSVSGDLNTTGFDAADGQQSVPIREAMTLARRFLLAGDGGYLNYWDSAEAQVVADWVQDEAPSCVSAIHESGQQDEFERLVSRYVRHMAAVSAVCNRLGSAITSLLLTSDATTALKMIGHAIRVYARGNKSYTGTASEVLAMLQRHDRVARDNTYLKAKTYSTFETSDAIDAIRHHELARDACFVVQQDRLPAPLRTAAPNEKWCLVVTLPAGMRQHLSAICVDSFYLDCFFTQATGVRDSFHLRLSINQSFSCAFNGLWSMLPRFRGSLPVAYVFDRECVVVSHRFNACLEMDAISRVSNKHRRTVSINDGDWSQWLHANNLPLDSQFQPRILNQVVELGNATLTDGA